MNCHARNALKFGLAIRSSGSDIFVSLYLVQADETLLNRIDREEALLHDEIAVRRGLTVARQQQNLGLLRQPWLGMGDSPAREHLIHLTRRSA